MGQINFQGNPLNIVGDLPAVGSQAPKFTLVSGDLADISLDSLKGKKVVLNIFPSIDTPVCATSVRKFNEESNQLDNTVILCISADLPFAHGRFCAAEGLEHVQAVSTFRSNFGDDYGVTITEGVLTGLLSRAVVIIDEQGKIIYTQQVPDLADEPDYEVALKHVS